MTNDAERGAAILGRVRAAMGPEVVELLLKSSETAPPELREWPPERMFQYLRCRFSFTQLELAKKAGLTQSQVSRMESGADCLLSTWTRVYAAMGFELKLLPAGKASVEELERHAELGRPQGHWLRQRARPRRFWVDGKMISQAEWNAAREAERRQPPEVPASAQKLWPLP